MRRIPLLAAVAFMLLLSSSAKAQRRVAAPAHADVKPTSAETVDMTLTVGDNRTIVADDVASYSVGTPGVVDVKVTPDLKKFVLVAQRSGTTTILMLKKNGAEVTYAISVFALPWDEVEKQLKALLSGYPALTIRRIGTRGYIEGGVSTDADVQRIGLIAGLFGDQVQSLVVKGSVGAEHKVNVRIDFYFVQYDKTSSYGVGLAYPARIGGGAFNGAHDLMTGNSTATLTAAQALPALDLAQTRGWAKVLKHSSVTTTSGSEATFDSGGEQNFSVAAGLTGTIQAIKFGTNVTVLPRYEASSNELEVKVNANVSELTEPNGPNTLPGRSTSTVATFVHLKLGQSLVLSGIRSSTHSHSVRGLPGLSQIPVLGLLFGSHSNNEAEVEGAVFIIPSVVDSIPRKAHDIVADAMSQYEEYSGNIAELRKGMTR